MKPIPEILELCDETLRLAENVGAAPWTQDESLRWVIYGLNDDDTGMAFDDVEDADFITHNHTFTPSAARALKVAIEALRDKSIYETTMPSSQRVATNALQSISDSFQ